MSSLKLLKRQVIHQSLHLTGQVCAHQEEFTRKNGTACSTSRAGSVSHANYLRSKILYCILLLSRSCKQPRLPFHEYDRKTCFAFIGLHICRSFYRLAIMTLIYASLSKFHSLAEIAFRVPFLMLTEKKQGKLFRKRPDLFQIRQHSKKNCSK